MLQFTNLVFDTVEKSLEIKNGIEANSDILYNQIDIHG